MPGEKAPRTVAAANGIATDRTSGAVAVHDCYADADHLLAVRRDSAQFHVSFADQACEEARAP